MGFSALAFMKDKYKNSLDVKHSICKALSDVEPPFQKPIEAKLR